MKTRDVSPEGMGPRVASTSPLSASPVVGRSVPLAAIYCRLFAIRVQNHASLASHSRRQCQLVISVGCPPVPRSMAVSDSRFARRRGRYFAFATSSAGSSRIDEPSTEPRAQGPERVTCAPTRVSPCFSLCLAVVRGPHRSSRLPTVDRCGSVAVATSLVITRGGCLPWDPAEPQRFARDRETGGRDR